MKNAFSIITTCRGRLHHLKQTLPAMLAQGADEVIVVDYGCPDGTGDWVREHHPQATVVRAEDPIGFSLAIARNVGVARAKGEWLAFVDADSIMAPGALVWFDGNCASGSYLIAEWNEAKKDSSGALICRRTDLMLAGLYDEAIRGWGGEDTDMRQRLSATGLTRRSFPASLLEPIPHGDEMRDRFQHFSMQQMQVRSIIYLRAKMAINAAYGGFPICCRAAVLEEISRAVHARNATEPRDCYPFSFWRYCPACAERHSANVEIMLEKHRGGFFRRSGFRLVERAGVGQRGHA